MAGGFEAIMDALLEDGDGRWRRRNVNGLRVGASGKKRRAKKG